MKKVSLLVWVCIVSVGVFAATYTWEGTTGNFDDLTSWNPDVSSWATDDKCYFTTAATDVTMNTNHDFSGGEFYLNGGSILRFVDGADLSLRKLYLGEGGMGSIIQTGGSFTLNNDYFYIGNSGGTGSYTISGGSFYVKKFSMSDSTGTFTVIGDATTQILTDRLYLGQDRGGNIGAATAEFQVASTGVTPIGIEGDDFVIGSTAGLQVTTTATLGAGDIVLFSYTKNSAIKGDGVFGSLNGGSAAEGTQISLGGNTYELTYQYDVGAAGQNNDVALVFVEGGIVPSGAHTPNPQDDAIVDSTLTLLDWINPDPNILGTPVTCTVYLGTNQDRQQMDQVTLGADISEVSIHTSNFPIYGNLVNQTRYYWAVDVVDSSTQSDPIPGDMWSFFVDDNIAPTVDAGPDQIVWLGKSGTLGQEVIDLDGTTSDDGSYTVLWTQVNNGAPVVTISPDDVDDTSVTVTARGTYEFILTADDGTRQTYDTVQITTGDDSCDASHMSTGAPYDAEDINQDCIVNLADFTILFADDWLVCTDMLTNCGN